MYFFKIVVQSSIPVVLLFFVLFHEHSKPTVFLDKKKDTLKRIGFFCDENFTNAFLGLNSVDIKLLKQYYGFTASVKGSGDMNIKKCCVRCFWCDKEFYIAPTVNDVAIMSKMYNIVKNIAYVTNTSFFMVQFLFYEENFENLSKYSDWKRGTSSIQDKQLRFVFYSMLESELAEDTTDMFRQLGHINNKFDNGSLGAFHPTLVDTVDTVDTKDVEVLCDIKDEQGSGYCIDNMFETENHKFIVERRDNGKTQDYEPIKGIGFAVLAECYCFETSKCIKLVIQKLLVEDDYKLTIILKVINYICKPLITDHRYSNELVILKIQASLLRLFKKVNENYTIPYLMQTLNGIKDSTNPRGFIGYNDDEEEDQRQQHDGSMELPVQNYQVSKIRLQGEVSKLTWAYGNDPRISEPSEIACTLKSLVFRLIEYITQKMSAVYIQSNDKEALKNFTGLTNENFIFILPYVSHSMSLKPINPFNIN